ncbi:protein NCBP2AS2 homolog [Haliotis rubra]|uniref:protein NCBP2AS2 homolog n=1 Tax=Haliotis rubra TaxID=36100 RepID=UPI001EE51344|nr:protein NCBP2AS2 homolog [Haliotis rubra]
MPLRALLRYLMQNEQVVQKLAESYPIRRAAQLTAYMLHRGREAGLQSLEKIQEADVVNKLQQEAKNSGQKFDNFRNTFTKELKEGMNEVKEEMKKKK